MYIVFDFICLFALFLFRHFKASTVWDVDGFVQSIEVLRSLVQVLPEIFGVEFKSTDALDDRW